MRQKLTKVELTANRKQQHSSSGFLSSLKKKNKSKSLKRGCFNPEVTGQVFRVEFLTT
jgi:hypothetical protein